MIDIKDAKLQVDDMTKSLSEIVNDIVDKQSKTLDDLVKKLHKVDELTNDEIRKLLISVSVEAYILSNYKEQSSLKESCATALYKEGMANSYNINSGTVESRKNQSLQDNLDKQIVNILYSNVCDRFTAKVHEAHKLASVLSNILISRASDAKLYYNPRSEGTEGMVTITEDGELEVF